MDEACSRNGTDEKCIQLIENPDGKTPLRRSKHRWEVDIGKDIAERGWACVDWMQLTQNWTNGGCCERSNEPLGSIKKRRGISGLVE
jgi:hypothetical protein